MPYWEAGGVGGISPFIPPFLPGSRQDSKIAKARLDSALGVNHTWALVLDGQLGEPHDLEQICSLQVADPCL